MSFDTLNPFSEVYGLSINASNPVGIAFKETNLPLRIPFFNGTKVVYKVLSGINQSETEYLFSTFSDANTLTGRYDFAAAFSSDRFITYAYTKSLIDLFQACSKYNNELWWQTHLVSRLGFLANRNPALLKPVLVLPKSEVLQDSPAVSICLYGMQPTIPAYQYITPRPYAYGRADQTMVMLNCPLNFSTDYSSFYDLVDLTSWGPVAVNLDHGNSFVFTFESKAYVFNYFDALKNMTTDVTGGTAVTLNQEQVATLEAGGSVTLPMSFNFTFYGEVVSFTCDVALTKLTADIKYLTLSGTTSNGLQFKGVDSTLTNFVYYTNEDKTYGSCTMTFTIMAGLVSNHALITFSENIVEQDFSSYDILDAIASRYSSESIKGFMKKSMMNWNPGTFGSGPFVDSNDSGLEYITATGYVTLGTSGTTPTSLIRYEARKNLEAYPNSNFYLDQIKLSSNAYCFNALDVSYSSRHFTNIYENNVYDTTYNIKSATLYAVGSGRDLSVSLVSMYYNTYNYSGSSYPYISQVSTDLTMLKSMKISCDEYGNLQVIDTSGVDTKSLGSYSFNSYFGYTPAEEFYSSLGNAPFITINGVESIEFGYGHGTQYSEECDTYYDVNTKTLGDFKFYYAPIDSVTATVSFGSSNLGFSVIKHDDRSSNYINSSTSPAVIEGLAYGNYVNVKPQTRLHSWADGYQSAPDVPNYTFSGSFVNYPGQLFTQGRILLSYALQYPYGSFVYWYSPAHGVYFNEALGFGMSYTVIGNINTAINCDTQLLENALVNYYGFPRTGFATSYMPSTDLLPTVEFNNNSGGIYVFRDEYEHVYGVCDATRSIVSKLYYNAMGANLFINNYSSYYRKYYFSTKTLLSMSLSNTAYLSLGLVTLQSLSALNNLQMLHWKRYEYLMLGDFYNLVVAYRVKDGDIIGIAIGAYKQIRNKTSQLFNLVTATTQEAWDNSVNSVLDDWIPVHNYNMPDNFMALMPIICLEAPIVHIFEDFNTTYTQNL
jgi:hypothetical protein